MDQSVPFMDRGVALEQNLFVVPASGDDAKSHLEQTIARPVDRATILAHISEEDLRRRGIRDDDEIYVWGADPGPVNIKTWQGMKPGDTVLFYQKKFYTYMASVVSTLRDPGLARALWGAKDNGATWELVFLLRSPVKIKKALDDLADYLQGSPYQGFVRIPAYRMAKILAEYTTLAEFFNQRLLKSDSTFLLLRSNEDSSWDDAEAESYSYGKTVPNYTKILPGARFIMDRKTKDGTVFVGAGEIAGVQAVKDAPGKFLASYSSYVHFDPPRVLSDDDLALIRAQEKYNVQHAIRVLSEAAYRKLMQQEYSAIVKLDPERFAKSIYWELEAAEDLLSVFERSPQLILAGPPGTGKSFVATKLAEVATQNGGTIERVQFHPSYQYEDFVEGIRPVLVTGEDSDDNLGQVAYRLHDGILKRLVKRALQNPARSFVLIIDELNRANVAKVFGELLFCLEYREADYAVRLPYSNETFYVPRNVKIIATMNTADRSIALIDAAFRRRFHQYALPPSPDVVRRWGETHELQEIAKEAAGRLARLNDALIQLVDSGKLIGHSFFMRKDLANVGFEAIWNEDLDPIIGEHLFSAPAELERCREAFMRL